MNRADRMPGGGAGGEYDIMSYNLNDDHAYIGDLVLGTGMSPAASRVTAPVPVPPNEGLYSFYAKLIGRALSR